MIKDKVNHPYDSESKRMAAILQSPQMVNELLPLLNDNHWKLDGNQWIWNKVKIHNAVHKTIPTISILLDYAIGSKDDSERVAVAAASVLLQEYKTPLTQSETEYFKTTILDEARNTALKRNLLPLIMNNDWQAVTNEIDKSTLSLKPLPTRLDLKSLMTKPSNDPQNLLNEWAFERQAIIALVAPTGLGKSVMAMQLSTHFACGKETIGFKPHKAYKVLVIQNEDSDNDIAIMRDGSMSILADKEKEMVYDNLIFIRLRGCSGHSFLSALDAYCNQFNPDIVFVNPLLKYYGGDPLNVKEVSNFLNELEPILERHNCGMIFIHHTIKQSKQSRMNQVDSSYSGFGSSAWSNSVRDTIELRKSKCEGYYELLTGKRSSKWGFEKQFIRRSSNYQLPYWIDITETELQQCLIKADKTNAVSTEHKDSIYDMIRPLPLTMTISELETESGLCSKSVRKYVNELVDEHKVAIADVRNEGTKGKPLMRYYKISNSNN